jgi:hypothetical protein
VTGLSRQRSRRCWKPPMNRSFGPVPRASDQDEAPSSASAMWLELTELEQALYVTGSGGQRVFIWNKPPSWCSVFSKVVNAKDIQPLPLMSWAQGRSYEQRQGLDAATGQRCQRCGRTGLRLVVHHPNRLGRKRKRKRGPANVIASGQQQQVKLLCLACHQQHHPDGWRGMPRRRQCVTGELGAATSCLPSSEGAGRRRATVMP